MRHNAATMEDRLENIKESFNDQIPVQEITDIVTQVMGSIEGANPLESIHVHDEIKELLSYINQTKSELSSLRPKEYSVNRLPEASSELDAIVGSTEEAAEKIMDSADEIAALADTAEGELQEKLANISINLFEASGFQDLTGQRITKVVKTLAHLEERLHSLAEIIGDDDVDENVEDTNYAEKDYAAMENEEFLHGPQLEDEAQDQAAIDALFDDF